MASNVKVFIDSENDGTLRQNVPDRLVHLTVTYTDEQGQPQTLVKDEYLLVAINWLITNYPARAKMILQDLVLDIARIRYGVDEVEDMS